MSKELKYDETVFNAFSFLKENNLGDMCLYFDKDFDDYYIVVKNHIYNTEKYNIVIEEFMRNFDISNISVLAEKYIINTDVMSLIEKYVSYKAINLNKYEFIISSTTIQQQIHKFYQISKTERVFDEDIRNSTIDPMVA